MKILLKGKVKIRVKIVNQKNKKKKNNSLNNPNNPHKIQFNLRFKTQQQSKKETSPYQIKKTLLKFLKNN
jgi:hypothetical protein